MKWSALKDELRRDMDDASGTPKWDDATLFTYLRDAIGDYSQYLPRRIEGMDLVADAENRMKFALPPDFLSEATVECPAMNYLEPSRGRVGVRVTGSSKPLYYRVDKPYLFLNADPVANGVVLGYHAIHGMPATPTDDEFKLTVPDADIELIKLYIEGKINTKIRNSQARLDRFKLGAGARTDNPLKYEVEDFFREYHEKIQTRMPKRSVSLHRPRRYK